MAGEGSRKLGTAGLSLQGDRTEGELGRGGGMRGQKEKEKERGRHVQAGRQAGRLLTGSFEAAAGWSGGLTSCASADLSPHFSTSSSSPNSTSPPPHKPESSPKCRQIYTHTHPTHDHLSVGGELSL